MARRRRAPRLLVTHREAAVLLEHARVRTEGGRAVYDLAEDGVIKSFNIPFANLAVLFLGQGSSISTHAARLLAEEKVFIALTGTGGTPLHFGSMDTFEPNERAISMFRVSQSPDLSLKAAKILLTHRTRVMEADSIQISNTLECSIDSAELRTHCQHFRNALIQAQSPETLRGMEGEFAKSCFKIFARGSGLDNFTRQHGKGDRDSLENLANSRIDHGNYLAYGTASAALWATGIHRGLSVLHGKTRAGGLVLDLADGFKDALVLPYAFSSWNSDQDFRQHLIDAIHNREILKRTFELLSSVLQLDEQYRKS